MILFSLIALILPDSINIQKPYLFKEIEQAEKSFELNEIVVDKKEESPVNNDNSMN